jgi:hypothetical protein
MAYFCLTYVQSVAGNRSKASGLFGIHRDVLNEIGRLTSTVGDAATARKWDNLQDRRPHTPNEEQWIDAAIRALIHRVGEHAAGATLQQITMADLPPLV